MKKISFGIMAAIFVMGIFAGYTLGLWQQIAQKQNREIVIRQK